MRASDVIDGSLQEAGKPDETGDESSPCEVDDRGASDVIDGSLQEAGRNRTRPGMTERYVWSRGIVAYSNGGVKVHPDDEGSRAQRGLRTSR